MSSGSPFVACTQSLNEQRMQLEQAADEHLASSPATVEIASNCTTPSVFLRGIYEVRWELSKRTHATILLLRERLNSFNG